MMRNVHDTYANQGGKEGMHNRKTGENRNRQFRRGVTSTAHPHMVRCSKWLKIINIQNKVTMSYCFILMKLEKGETWIMLLICPFSRRETWGLVGRKCKGCLPSPHSWEVAGQEVNTGSFRSQSPDSQLLSGSLGSATPPLHSQIHSFIYPSFNTSNCAPTLDGYSCDQIGPVSADNVNHTNSCLMTTCQFYRRLVPKALTWQMGKNELLGERV